ncbi:MAG: bifunctional hydroxymethylpyrimidine kinase/phosphomethylpyrimidine kinase, partial [Gemmatimonadetes bacterium]|nr:bifunctional hydroxymethylpyrimidine kinase/phosphomethylpyrimidine kinase [Gemmatimonadota bacterium]
METHSRPVTCTIAGSDSGGGAGIQADLKTFHQHGVFGTSVLTAITAQNTLGVQGVHAVPVAMVRAQIDALADDLPPAAFKTGMLATADLVGTVADAITDHGWTGYVLDPVMVATSGDRLLAEDAVEVIRTRLLPLATLVTPNREEAEILTGAAIEGLDDAERAARALVARGAGAALVKGGHPRHEDAVLVDVLFDGHAVHRFTHDRIATRHTHGTGCTLSAAAVAGLAWGRPLVEAVGDAIAFVGRALAGAPGL